MMNTDPSDLPPDLARFLGIKAEPKPVPEAVLAALKLSRKTCGQSH